MTIRLLIVDDQPTVRQGLKMFLQLDEDIEIVGEAENGQQAIERVLDTEPNVVLMDLLMPVMDGISAIGHLRQQFPNLYIIALTSTQDDDLLRDAIFAGADYYIYKTISPQVLLGIIKAIAEGRVLLPNTISAKLLPHLKMTPPERILLAPEKDLLQLLFHNASTSEILEKLNIDAFTYDLLIKQLASVFKVTSRIMLVLTALHLNLLTSD